MEQTILNPLQQKVLNKFKNSPLNKKYYLSGGTALAEFYLHHRRSEDLDFFTQEELNLDELKRFIHAVSKLIKIGKIEFQRGFGLYTFFLHEDKGKLKHKIDFGQYPFEPIEKLRKVRGILIESMYDMAVNKAQTIAFRPRLRDFVDLYFILRREKSWSFQELLKRSFEKFEMRADALQVGENLLQVKKLKDMPIMVKKLDLAAMQEFFLAEVRKLDKKIWEKS